MDLIFATQNAHKLQEVTQILGQNVSVRSLSDLGFEDDIPETADTLAGNSLLKAQFVWDRWHRNCFADDTGLIVPALGGEPSVYTARYAALYGGPDHDSQANRKTLLERLGKHAESILSNRPATDQLPTSYRPATDEDGWKEAERKAYFCTVITLIMDGEVHQFEGRVDGVITETEQGDGGFGYDCLFQPDGYDKTFAQLSPEEKNAISHRGRAMQKLKEFLETR